MSSSRTVVKSVLAIAQSEGVGAIVKRSIGTQQLRNLSPFLMLDEFNVAPGAGFPDHPHRGQSTVTYMLDGQFQHEDFAGHRGLIGPGDVQWMIAGKGIMHAEMPVHTPGGPNPTGLQLWIDLPKAEKMSEPLYQELKSTEISTAYPSEDIEIRVISGESHGVTGKVRSRGGAYYYDFKLKKNGATAFQPLPKGWTAFVYTLTGSLLVGDSKQAYPPSTTVVLSSKSSEEGVQLTSASDGETRFVLIAGEPLSQAVVQHGPFVLTSREDVIQAFSDYQNSENGFERAKGWESEIGKAMR
ncbi:RmlC-like cupin domain-containing protein [Mrakia frigida]|uniref:pirin family protein n=1 Tax=Mrakia frigida TaxID=29902 RepID=UPI003FCBFA88